MKTINKKSQRLSEIITYVTWPLAIGSLMATNSIDAEQANTLHNVLTGIEIGSCITNPIAAITAIYHNSKNSHKVVYNQLSKEYSKQLLVQ